MFADGRGVADNASLDCDLCIVGARAAGITLGRELTGSGLSVHVLEAGGLQYEPGTQVLYRGESIGHPYFSLDSARLRMFGGTTGHWLGWCRPLDPIDFEPRDWVADSGWPIRREELDPFYARAQRYVRIGPFNYSTPFWERATRARAFRLPHRLIDTAVFQYSSPPTRFGLAYREDLRRAENITVFLHSNVTGIELAPDASRVEEVRVATLAGKRFRVRRAPVRRCGRRDRDTAAAALVDQRAADRCGQRARPRGPVLRRPSARAGRARHAPHGALGRLPLPPS